MRRRPCALTMQGKVNRDDLVVVRFKECIDDFKQIMPLVEECANPALQKRHWCASSSSPPPGMDAPPFGLGPRRDAFLHAKRPRGNQQIKP